MKIHSSYDIKIKSISGDLMKHGITLVDDCGTQTLEQFKDIEYGVLCELGHAADLIDTETEKYQIQFGSIFVIRNPDRIDENETRLLIAKSIP